MSDGFSLNQPITITHMGRVAMATCADRKSDTCYINLSLNCHGLWLVKPHETHQNAVKETEILQVADLSL